MCEQDPPQTLNDILQALPSPASNQLSPLPIAHLTNADSFANIVNDRGKLRASLCPVFQCDLIYFSYGEVFHRHRQEPTRERKQLPVAFLFNPSLLDRINCFFPYDTGAAHHGKYGAFSNELSQFENFIIPNNSIEPYQLPSKLIYYTYGSNQNYIKGDAMPEDSQHPLRRLLEFLNTDITQFGTDHRQYSIECQTSQLIELQQVFREIIWIGLPEDKECLRQFKNLCEMVTPLSPPEYYTYSVSKVSNPYVLAGVLQENAKKAVIDPRYLNFGSLGA